MSAGRFFTIAFTLAVASALPAVPALAQDASTTPDVANSKYQFSGTINANTVNVRSGPSDNFYPVAKLDQGAQVTVVGIKNDWLKITPPEGSFSYIAKAYVTKNGDSRGVVEKNDVYVRAGSLLNDMKTTVQMKLDQGAEVKIIGEKDEYWKIAPLPSSFVYVKKDYVTPGKPLPTANAGAVAVDTGTTGAAAATVKEVEPQNVEPVKPVEPTAAAPTTAPSEPTAAVETTTATTQPVSDAGATTQPTKVSATDAFDKLESEFQAFSKDKLEDQPLADALTRYQELTANTELPESMRRVADVRVTTIKTRMEVREQYLAVLEAQKASEQRKIAMKAEKQELEDRIQKTKVTVYSAIGTLQTSSLQNGPKVLYRLTDPSTGRTLVYIRTDDAKYATLIGQFVGVNGPTTDDATMNLKYIDPTETKAVDRTAVGSTVTAQIIPPSILENLGTAAVGQN